MSTPAIPRRRMRLPDRYDFGRTLSALQFGRQDPATRLTDGQLWRASRTPDGPGSVEVRRCGDALLATGYGPGGDWLVDHADALTGLRDDPADFTRLARTHPTVALLADAMPGIRLVRTHRVFEQLLRSVLEQKVTGVEAMAAHRRLLRRLGEPAPGPVELTVPPAPETLAGTPYWALHPLGIERRRADTLRRVATVAASLERLAGLPAEVARRKLTSVPGIGAWTAAEVTAVACGDADAVSVGDYHVPHQIARALTGAERGSDEQLLELLAPFAPHRARVVRLVLHGGIRQPRRAPRAPLRSFTRF